MRYSFATVLISVFIFFATSPALAANVQLSGKVVDNSGLPVNSTVNITDASTHKTVATLSTDPFGNYIVPVSPGDYTIMVIPPAGSYIAQTTRSNIHVGKNTTENFTFQTTSKLPQSGQKKNLGAVSSVILFEILAVVIVVVGFVLWKNKLISFTK